jgi:hypothetical protein
MTERYQRVRMDDLRHMKLFEKAKNQELIMSELKKVIDDMRKEIEEREAVVKDIKERYKKLKEIIDDKSE